VFVCLLVCSTWKIIIIIIASHEDEMNGNTWMLAGNKLIQMFMIQQLVVYVALHCAVVL